MTNGKVVLVAFPFDDQTAVKVRPALCLTDPIGPYRHIILAFISSRMPEDLLATDLRLEPDHADFPTTGLRVASAVRLHRLLTIPATIIRRELGHFPPGLRAEVARRLRLLFGLT